MAKTSVTLDQLNFGDRVRDRLSGFTGIVTGKHTFISGCAKVTIAPDELRDGKMQESQWVDVQFVEIVKARAFEVDNGRTPGGSDAPPAGPVR